MKALVLGWIRMKGNSKKNGGRPYDFAQVLLGNPVEIVANENMQKEGGGYETAQVDLRPGCEGAFRGLTYPGMYELVTENKVGRMGRIEIEVTGVLKPVAVVKSA